MANKFHLIPKPTDDSLSAAVYKTLLNKLDDDKEFFTQEDIKLLEPYKYKLDEEINQKSNAFVQKVAGIYQLRLTQMDTMVASICSKPFNFSLPESYTVAEDENYPANETALRSKLYKSIKSAVLYYVVDELSDTTLALAAQKKFVDSLEKYARKKYQVKYKRYLQSMLQKPGGIPGTVGLYFCEAIASYYDPHTEFFPLTVKENFDAELGQKGMIFGFTLEDDDDGNVTIGTLKPGSPAYKTGQLNKGDKFMSIQWEGKQPIDVSDATDNEISGILAASNHDKAIITVKKADGSLRAVTIAKEQAADDADEEDKVKSFMLKGSKNVGYISLPAFYIDWENEDNNINGCANDVAKEILKLKKENMQSLILDLRYNGGGSVQEAVELAGLFIDAGPVAQFKYKDPKPFTLKDANRGTIYDGPLFVMVNGFSASASEMVAGTLQDYHRAVVVGTSTYGKATGQIVLPMDTTIDLRDAGNSKRKASSYVKVTTSKLYRVTGTTAQFSGVQPDIILPDATLLAETKESGEPYALPPTSIDANKYYQPLSALPTAALGETATMKMNSIPYFNKMQQYIAQQKNKVRKDVPLRFADAVAYYDVRKKMLKMPLSEDNTNTSFTVNNLSFEQQKIQANESYKAANDAVRNYLAKDAALQVTFALAEKL